MIIRIVPDRWSALDLWSLLPCYRRDARKANKLLTQGIALGYWLIDPSGRYRVIADNQSSIFIITHKFRLAAAAAIIGGVRCHHWQRPLPIMFPPAANLKSMPFFPRRCLPLPVCRAPTLLNAHHFARHQQCSPAWHHYFSEPFADSVNNSYICTQYN